MSPNQGFGPFLERCIYVVVASKESARDIFDMQTSQ